MDRTAVRSRDSASTLIYAPAAVAAHRENDLDVAVVVVDTDRHPLSPATLDAIRQTSSSVRSEVVVVEARTTGGRAWAGDAHVRVIGASPDLTSTALRRRGVAATTAPVLAFLDARAVPTPAWLPRSLAVLRACDDVDAVSGASSSVGEPTVSFTGNVGARHPLDDRRPHEVLYPIPEAAVVRRSAVDALGDGWDERSWSSVVIELGWRLNLRGRRVVLDPAAGVVGGCTCDHDDFAGLVVINTCLGPASLEAALPAALAVVAGAGDPSGAAAVDRFVTEAAALAARRAEVQASRVVDDAPLLDLMITALEPARRDPGREAEHRDAVHRHVLRSSFPTRQRILVVTPDIFTARMAGPAIRAWQIADALAGRHLVHLVSTAGRCELTSKRFEVSAPEDRVLRSLSEDVDIIFFQGFAMEGRPYLGREDKIVVVDLYDPLHLEQLELFRDAPAPHRRVTLFGATRVLNEQLVRGDYFVCASPKQRDFWLGQLAALGRLNHATYDDDNRLNRLLGVVPFGLPDDPPTVTGRAIKGVVPGIDVDDEVILWGGGIYNWFDPLTLIEALDQLKERRPQVRLFFLGLRHPNPDVTEMRMATEARRLAKRRRLIDRFVFFNEGWVPYDERQNYLLEANVGVSTHFHHVETEFSFRTRILDYIWAGLPIVCTEGDAFAQLVTERGLGLVVPERDAATLEEALWRLLTDAELVASAQAALAEVRREFTWSRVLEPITSFCGAPRRAPDLSDPEVRAGLWATDAERRMRWLRELPSRQERLRRILSSR